MHPGLWLLFGLRLRGWVRRLYRGANTVRGALLLVFGSLVFISWVTPLLFQSAITPAQSPAEVRRWGPPALLGIWLINLLFSSSEGAITFSAGEVNLLFPAPLSRRQLLSYKILLLFASSVVSALFMALFFHRFATSYLAAALPLSLALSFLQLFTVFLALLASTVGARAYNQRRRIVLVLMLLVAVLVAVQVIASSSMPQDWREWLERLEESWLAQVLMSPLRCFVLAMTAERVWPDLVQWSALSALLNCLGLVVVFAMDAQYLEASARASEWRYARVQQMRRGGPLALNVFRSGVTRGRLPVFPSWGGVGPILWRQLSSAVRAFWSVVLMVLMTAAMSLPLWIDPVSGRQNLPVWPRLFGLFIGATLFVPALLPFDFRGDIDRMDMLKVLPVPAWRLVVGQLLTPILLISLAEILIIAVARVVRGVAETELLYVLAFAVPFNALIFEMENLLFLFFPTRTLAATPGDVQALGRQVIVWMVKLFTLAVMGGLAFLAGLLLYFLTGQTLVAGLFAAWVVVVAFVAGLVPLLGFAFRQFDVSRDTPP
jgi:putative ABC exporter